MAELIFLDLEWNTTFYRNRSGERVPFQELIEVAAVKVEQGSGAMMDSFHSYIHPKARKINSAIASSYRSSKCLMSSGCGASRLRTFPVTGWVSSRCAA